jgi:hypothetical protein
LPVIPHHTPSLDRNLQNRLHDLADKLLREDPDLASTAPFGDRVTAGLEPHPSLVVEDHSWITLFETVGDTSYSYRACTLAGDGDSVVVGIKRCRAFEDYCRDTLGVGDFEVLAPRTDSRTGPLSLRCAHDEGLVRRLAEKARRSGGLNVVPYMGTGGAWHLAGVIARAGHVPVTVAAAAPRLTRRINDKLWFARCVRDTLGPSAQPRTFAAYGLAALLKEISILARRNPAVAVKLPSSASSSGNVILDMRKLGGLPRSDQGRELDAALRVTGWRGDYPLLVSTWESPVFASPSVQLWVPRADQGDVVVEGIFDQALARPRFEFCGATPTGLSPDLQQDLANGAAALGSLFQRLGYFGRCSLDAILVGDREADAQIHWLECNGRWGGTSIPMTLANRLIGDWARVPLAVVERGEDHAPQWPFDQFRRDMEDHLFRQSGPMAGAIALSPSRIEAGAGYELLVLGKDRHDLWTRTQALAEAFAKRAVSPRPGGSKPA